MTPEATTQLQEAISKLIREYQKTTGMAVSTIFVKYDNTVAITVKVPE